MSASWVVGMNELRRVLRYRYVAVINIQSCSAITGMVILSISILTMLILEVFRVLQQCKWKLKY